MLKNIRVIGCTYLLSRASDASLFLDRSMLKDTDPYWVKLQESKKMNRKRGKKNK